MPNELYLIETYLGGCTMKNILTQKHSLLYKEKVEKVRKMLLMEEDPSRDWLVETFIGSQMPERTTKVRGIMFGEYRDQTGERRRNGCEGCKCCC